MNPQEWLRRGKGTFEIYLRTGVILNDPAAPLALKYNPWHDIEDGRFTRVGMGRKVPPKFGGFGGGRSGGGGASGTFGGGDFGGGGASGSWDPPVRTKPQPEASRPHLPVAASQGPHTSSPKSPSPIVQTIHANGYAFAMDAQHRTRKITGTLTNGPRSKRSRSMQRGAGNPDRLPQDDGGHYVAIRFNGPREKFNHFAQDSNVNRGRYRALEDQWGLDIAAGKAVKVDIRPRFNRDSVRPYRIDVIWHVNGARQSIKIPNQKGN